MFRRDIRDGVGLKLLEERHAPAVFAVVNRERAHLRKWLPWVDDTTGVGDTLNFIKTCLQQFANSEGLTAGIWCGDEYAGTIGSHKINWLNRKVEIGYWIAAKFQGKGIVTDACRALIDHAFEEWKLNRVEIHCAAGNKKSCANRSVWDFNWKGFFGKPSSCMANTWTARSTECWHVIGKERLNRQHVERSL
jgi:ribosomal-protein-serine acetyltransferase